MPGQLEQDIQLLSPLPAQLSRAQLRPGRAGGQRGAGRQVLSCASREGAGRAGLQP